MQLIWPVQGNNITNKGYDKKADFYFCRVSKMSGIYLLLGTNLGDRAANLAAARQGIGQLGIEIVQESGVYETAAWGKEDQAAFYNQVVHAHSTLAPAGLLSHLLELELQLGRKRLEKWGTRLIDIDILYYHDQVVQEEQLSIPHPGIPMRRFTLVPLVELAAQALHPVLQQTQEALLASCPDPLPVSLIG